MRSGAERPTVLPWRRGRETGGLQGRSFRGNFASVCSAKETREEDGAEPAAHEPDQPKQRFTDRTGVRIS